MSPFKLLIILALALFANSTLHSSQPKSLPVEHKILEAMIDTEPLELFKAFHLIYKKESEYSLESEIGAQRFEAFKENLNKIKLENLIQSEYHLGLTPFADLTFAEFKTKHLLKPEQIQKILSLGAKKFFSDENEEVEQYQSTTRTAIDWTPNFNTPRNQGLCGSCWAFATAGAIEGNNYFKTHSKTYLSPQQLVDCDSAANGCDGGDPGAALEYASHTGLVADSTYPYWGLQFSCKSNVINNNAKVQPTSITFADASTIDGWYAELQKGPLAVVVEAGWKFQLYLWGVMSLTGCGTPDHAVIAAGWGTDSGEYVHLRNSWGSTWGLNGYGKVKFDAAGKTCGLTSYGVRPNF